jgi:hypothetical protein
MREAQKGFTTMKTAEATSTEYTATVAEQGATVASETASSKKAATHITGHSSCPRGVNLFRVWRVQRLDRINGEEPGQSADLDRLR